jgi:mRNA-degrading endonuclease toxin of MazEF toxin-antitoxin module
MPTAPTVIKQGETYWCEPDPKDTEGSEQKGDRVWLIISVSQLHRGNCVVALPFSRHIEKKAAHLIQIPKNEITVEDGSTPIDRVALTDQIRTLDKTRLRKKAGYVSVRAINAVKLGLDYLFGNSPVPRSSS